MNPRHIFASACVAWLALAGSAQAQQHDPATPPAVASKIALRGDRAAAQEFAGCFSLRPQIRSRSESPEDSAQAPGDSST